MKGGRLMKEGHLIEGGGYQFFLSTYCKFILAKTLIEKQKLQPST